MQTNASRPLGKILVEGLSSNNREIQGIDVDWFVNCWFVDCCGASETPIQLTRV